MKTKFFTIAAAIVLALGLSATESKAQSSAVPSAGIANKKVVLSLSGFPNPTTDVINVVTVIPAPMEGQAKIKIASASGQELNLDMCSDCAGKTVRSYDVSSYAPGTYFVILDYNGTIKSIKFVKQ